MMLLQTSCRHRHQRQRRRRVGSGPGGSSPGSGRRSCQVPTFRPSHRESPPWRWTRSTWPVPAMRGLFGGYEELELPLYIVSGDDFPDMATCSRDMRPPRSLVTVADWSDAVVPRVMARGPVMVAPAAIAFDHGAARAWSRRRRHHWHQLETESR